MVRAASGVGDDGESLPRKRNDETLSPLCAILGTPANPGDVLKNFKRIIIPEFNLGRLRMLIHARYLVDAIGINHIRGRTFQGRGIEG